MPTHGYRKCSQCGQVKPTKHFTTNRKNHGRKPGKVGHICSACLKANEERRRQQIARWERFGRDCPRCGKRRSCPNEIGKAHNAVCLSCRLAQRAAKQRDTRAASPGTNAERCRAWRKANPEGTREAQRRYREKRKLYEAEHPEERERRLELRRISEGARRMENGARKKVSQQGASTDGDVYLPAQPLYEVLKPIIARFERVDYDSTLQGEYGRRYDERFQEVIGTSPRNVLDWRKGKRRSVQFSTLDRILTLHNLNWFDVYEKPVNGHEPEKLEAYRAAHLAFTGEPAD